MDEAEEEEVRKAARFLACAACLGRHRAHTCGTARAAPSEPSIHEPSIHVAKHAGPSIHVAKHAGGTHAAGTHAGGMHVGGTNEASAPVASKVAMGNAYTGKSAMGKSAMGEASAACTRACMHAYIMQACMHTYRHSYQAQAVESYRHA